MQRRPGRRRRGWRAQRSTRAAGGAIGPNGSRPVPERECRRRLSAVLPTRRSRTHREAMFWKNSMGDLSLSDIKSGGIRVQILTAVKREFYWLEASPFGFVRMRQNDTGKGDRTDILGADIVAFLRRSHC